MPTITQPIVGPATGSHCTAPLTTSRAMKRTANIQAADAYTYEPEADKRYPYTAWELVVSYKPVIERGEGISGQVSFEDITIDGVVNATAWCGDWGSPIVLEPDYRKEVMRYLVRELDESVGKSYGLWSELVKHCRNDYEKQLSLAD